MSFLAPLVLAISLPFVLGACRPEKGYGMLVADYSDGSTRTLFRTRVVLPRPEDSYRFNYELRSGEKICTLTGELNLKEIPANDECPGTKGRGKISCNDGKPMKIRWSMSSCQDGSGRSMGKGKAKFYFGYAHNKESAQDLLARVTGSEN